MRRVVFSFRQFPDGQEPELVDILRWLGAEYVVPRTWIVGAWDIVPWSEGLGLSQPRDAAVAEWLVGERRWGNNGWVAYDGLTLLHRAAETGQCISAEILRLREGAPVEPPACENPYAADCEEEALLVEDPGYPNADCYIWFCDSSVAIIFLEDEARADLLERYARREL